MAQNGRRSRVTTVTGELPSVRRRRFQHVSISASQPTGSTHRPCWCYCGHTSPSTARGPAAASTSKSSRRSTSSAVPGGTRCCRCRASEFWDPRLCAVRQRQRPYAQQVNVANGVVVGEDQGQLLSL